MRNAVKNLHAQWPKNRREEQWSDEVISDGDLNGIWQEHERGRMEHDVYKKSRNSVKIGKFINKLFPGKYNDKEVEEFVNNFKATIENSGEKFEIVEGNDIEFWYDSNNYAERSGTLGNSCMAQKKGIFNIYTKNPEVCRMLILKEDDKILGRALIWKLSSCEVYGVDTTNIEYFMDRQYTIKDSDVIKFRNYAKDQKNWISKANNNHHSFTPVLIHSTESDQEKNANMTIKVKKADAGKDNDYDYGRYPYLDTFRRYNPKDGTLYNDDEQGSDYEGDYILEDTGGGYTEIEGGYYSEWHDRMIPEDQAIRSDVYGDWIYRDQSVEVERGSRSGIYHQDDDYIVYDENLEEYIHQDDSVYSEALGHHIFDDTAVRVVVEIDSDGDVDSNGDWYPEDYDDIIKIDKDMTWYEFLESKFNSWGDFDYIVKSTNKYKHGIGWVENDIMIKNNNGDWIPKMFSIKEYKLIPTDNAVDITGIEYLTEMDAESLGYKINKNEEIISDQFQYHKDIEEFIPLIYKKLSDEWVRLIDYQRGKGQLRIKFKDFNEDDYLKSLKKRAELLNNRLEDIENDEYIVTDITITRND